MRLIETKKRSNISEFRIGAKWANVIRFRWKEFSKYAQSFYVKELFGQKIYMPYLEWQGVSVAALTTTTFYPDPNPETTTVDGFAARDGIDETFATIRAGAGTASNDTAGTQLDVLLSESTTASQYDILRRAFLLFDTSSIGGDTIDSGTCGTYASLIQDSIGEACAMSLVTTTPASNTAIANSDYGNVGDTKQATDYTFASAGTSQYNTHTLNCRS